MASPGAHPNQVSPTPPFDINKFFAASSAAQHSIQLSYPPTPSSSYPPPTGAFPLLHQTPPFFGHYPPPAAAAGPPPANILIERSLSYPTPPLQAPNPSPGPNLSPNAGARLMALLSGPPAPAAPELSVPSLAGIPSTGPARLPSSKLPRGRHLTGDSVEYDVDVRVPGEAQPQLEVTPITKYGSDPQLVLGRQIAVNKSYICYGLKQGNIRVLNMHIASRSLLRGHTQRITDMAFFAEDVHLLASASTDRRICVWKIFEGPEEDDKLQITAEVIIAIQIQGEEESVHPRVCWHCHKQEILVVGVGRQVLRIDSTKLGKMGPFSAEEPIQCAIEKLIDGIQLVGVHDGEITDLSMCQWMTSRLVSASTDGSIKIWEDQKTQPLLVLRPHEGDPVHSATFVTSPHRPDHIILITMGPLNREVKVWASSNEEGWLLPSDAESWKCTQTLGLKSTAEPCVEDAFFNQVLVLSQTGLLLLANAKRNAIYAVHLDFDQNPAASRMDYLAEFTVTMPILSFTGTTGISSSGEHIIQLYCVQTQAIQNYALDLLLCTPPPLEIMGLQKSDSSVSCDAVKIERSAAIKPTDMSADSAPNSSENAIGSDAANPVDYPAAVPGGEAIRQDSASLNAEPRTIAMAQAVGDTDVVCVTSSSPPPLSPRLSRQLSGFGGPHSFEPGAAFSDHSRNHIVNDFSVDRQVDPNCEEMVHAGTFGNDLENGEKKISEDETPDLPNHPVTFKHPTHLITPSEILGVAPSSGTSDTIKGENQTEGNIQGETIDREVGSVEVEVKVVTDTSIQKDEFSPEDPRNLISRENFFCSQASDLAMHIAQECRVSPENNAIDEGIEANHSMATVSPPSSDNVNVIRNYVHDEVSEPGVTAMTLQTPTPAVKNKKQKGKNLHGTASSSSPSTFNSTGSSSEPVIDSSPSVEATFPQILVMQDKLNQVMAMQKELKKQMSATVNGPVTKEGRRLEAALGRSMEKTAKANCDALWTRFQEENIKKEKLLQDRVQHIINVLSNFIRTDFPATLERIVKRELATIQTSVLRAIAPAIEKTISSAITESFQKGVGDKAVNQLEKAIYAKLEAVVARQIQAQFQTSGKQALQDSLKSSFEATLLPGFEMSCKNMFEQVDTAFQRGMYEHTSAAVQHLETANSSLALALRDALNSASSVTQALSVELADGQRKLLSLAVAGANSSAMSPLASQLSSGSLVNLHEKVDVPVDPRKELTRLVSEHKYEEAFTSALQRSDVTIVSWLCSQVDLNKVLTLAPIPLSQGVLLSLLQQLACDIKNDTPRKLPWMIAVAGVINTTDPLIVMHVRPIFEQVYQILNHQRTLPSNTAPELSNIRLLMHVINSMLMTCK